MFYIKYLNYQQDREHNKFQCLWVKWYRYWMSKVSSTSKLPNHSWIFPLLCVDVDKFSWLLSNLYLYVSQDSQFQFYQPKHTTCNGFCCPILIRLVNCSLLTFWKLTSKQWLAVNTWYSSKIDPPHIWSLTILLFFLISSCIETRKGHASSKIEKNKVIM